jgi:hypothetical protein
MVIVLFFFHWHAAIHGKVRGWARPPGPPGARVRPVLGSHGTRPGRTVTAAWLCMHLSNSFGSACHGIRATARAVVSRRPGRGPAGPVSQAAGRVYFQPDFCLRLVKYAAAPACQRHSCANRDGLQPRAWRPGPAGAAVTSESDGHARTASRRLCIMIDPAWY